MNPDAVEWLESQPLTHPWLAAMRDEALPGPTAVRKMVELIDDHETTYDIYGRGPCGRCGTDPIIL